MRLEPGAEVPRDFVPSGYVVPPLRTPKGSQVHRRHTSRNDEHVGLEPPKPEGSRLSSRPPPANSPTYIPAKSITALLTTNLLRMGQALVRFDKLLAF